MTGGALERHTGIGNVDVESLEHVCERDAHRRRLEPANVLALDLLLDGPRERADAQAAPRARHLDAHVAVAGRAHGVEQRGDE